MIRAEILLSLLVGATLVSTGWHEWRQRRAAAALAKAQAAIATCVHLLDLLAHLQQHRGMSSAWLAGDTQFETGMTRKREEIAAKLCLLEDALLCETETPWGTKRHEFAAFLVRWRHVTDSMSVSSVDQNFAQHGCLITVVLNWLTTLGEQHIEGAGRGNKAANFFHRLPMLSECLAQARGIGTSVAARRGCSPVARVRLMFLIGRAESLLRQIEASGEGAEGSARHAVSTMGQLVRRSMLLSSGVAVSTEAYFAMTSQTIDAVLDWARASGLEVSASLAQFSARTSRPWLSAHGG